MKKIIFLALPLLGILLFAVSLSASSPFDITFPIPELGSCTDKNGCKAYCDDLSNKTECLEFAKKHGLISEEESHEAERLPEVGPGGCNSEEQCRVYCEDPGHLNECIDFGVANGFMSPEEADRIRAEAGKTGPGGCGGYEECRSYCEDPGHKGECLEHARSEGLTSDKDYELVKRVTDEGGPGGCRSERECRAYCEDPAHIEECLSFGEEHGVVPPEEVKRIKKLALAGGPGGCKGEEQCRNFCEIPANQLTCIDWAVQNGLMPEEEAAIARKVAGKAGPGGCTGEQCRDYCENPENTDVCLEFAEREGILPPEELQRAKKFLKATQEGGPGGCQGIECRNYCEDPAHTEECFNFAKDQGLLPPGAEEDFEVGQKIMKKVEESGGPGGCRTDGECQTYCSEPQNVEECVAFGAAHGGVPEEEVRRMLKDFQEQRYEAHFEIGGDFGPPGGDFRHFEEESRKRFEEFRQLEEHFRGKEFPGGGFPGGPGEFPGGPPGGFPGGSPEGFEFKGPGGCSSPAECIKYCTEHKEECFSSGPPGGGFPGGGPPGFRSPEGGIPPGHDFPQIRGGLIQDFSGFSFRKKDTGRYELFINDSDGIQEFSLNPTSGSPYGGGLSCGEEYKTDVSFPPSAFPIAAFYVDCAGNRTEKTFSAEFPAGDGFKPPEGFGQEFPGGPPEGFPEDISPEDFFKHLPSNGPLPGTPGVFGPFPQPVGTPTHEGIGPIPGTPGILPPEHQPEGFLPPEAGGGFPAGEFSGFCPALPTVDSCPSGQKKTVTFSSPECGTFYTCVPETFEGTAPASEPTYSGTDPAIECANQGGKWTGNSCEFSSVSPPPAGSTTEPPPPPTEPTPPAEPPPPPPAATEDPSARCAQEGGTWDGSTCIFPEGSGEPHSRAPQRKGFFALILDFFR